MKRKIVFLTGTRADYGKLKPLIRILADSNDFEPYIFATGMHLLPRYGSTYREIEKDGFSNLHLFSNQDGVNLMDVTLARTIEGFSRYVRDLRPDAVVVHGDRLEALAGAVVGAFNNVKVLHVEGGEVSGTIDESIRHAVSKLAHYHFVANDAARRRLVQLGEPEANIVIFGSPDIDVMYSGSLPSLAAVKEHYAIGFGSYSICMYHPVTTEVKRLAVNIRAVVDAMLRTDDCYVVIYPNNDSGSEIILHEYGRLQGNERFRLFPSIRFEAFLTLLKHADMIVGNSSSGVREASIYAVPAVDIGSRQHGRYDVRQFHNIVHADENVADLISAMQKARNLVLSEDSLFGDGRSSEIFVNVLRNESLWEADVQKRFVDIDF